MHTRLERWSAVAGVLAVVLWILGLVVTNALTHKIPSHPSDAQLLTWIKGNANTIIFGNWLWMVGCLAFVWFAAMLRGRLAAAEGGPSTFATISFAGAVAAAVFGMLISAGDVASAINSNSVSAATAGTLHHAGDMFFVCAELASILFLLGAAIAALRTRVLPRAWAYFAILISVVLLIGPIGWAGLVFGVPIWTLGTTWFLVRGAREPMPTAAPATG